MGLAAGMLALCSTGLVMAQDAVRNMGQAYGICRAQVQGVAIDDMGDDDVRIKSSQGCSGVWYTFNPGRAVSKRPWSMVKRALL